MFSPTFCEVFCCYKFYDFFLWAAAGKHDGVTPLQIKKEIPASNLNQGSPPSLFSRIKMAARIRLKLNFDGSVCPQITPRKCWFLVNKDDCNVVADLEYLIRERFELDRGQILSLTLDSFLLPSMEKIHVVRDNDTIWYGVKIFLKALISYFVIIQLIV